LAAGKTHDKVTYMTIPLIVIIQLLIVKEIQLIILNTILYTFAALMFSGDLDIRSVQINRWGILKVICIPYRKIFNHRPSFTHGVIDATVIRIIYLVLWIYLFLSVLNIIYPEYIISGNQFIRLVISFIKENVLLSLSMLCSLMLGSISHTLTDYIYSLLKKRKAKKKKNKSNRK